MTAFPESQHSNCCAPFKRLESQFSVILAKIMVSLAGESE